MDSNTLAIYLIAAFCALCLAFIASRMLRPLLQPFLALGADSDNLTACACSQEGNLKMDVLSTSLTQEESRVG